MDNVKVVMNQWDVRNAYIIIMNSNAKVVQIICLQLKKDVNHVQPTSKLVNYLVITLFVLSVKLDIKQAMKVNVLHVQKNIDAKNVSTRMVRVGAKVVEMMTLLLMGSVNLKDTNASL